jgi:hypothetical protein
MESSQIVTFVIDKNLDIASHFIALNSYKRNKEREFQQNKDNNLENLSKLVSQEEVQVEIEKSIDQYYKKEEKLLSLARDVNEEWAKIEEGFVRRLEAIHKFPFPLASVKGVLSSASRWGYKVDEGWFATSMFRNKFLCIDTATHELMHFMFHKYYDQVCEDRGLSKNQMWDIKESFTVLLDIEFNDFRFQSEYGYQPHMKLREVIKKSWEKNRDFGKTLEEAIDCVKSDSCL